MTYFWRAKDTATGQERKFRSDIAPQADFEQFRQWVNSRFRNLELLEYAPWDEPTHGGVLYPVPVQHVKFDAPKPEIDKPAPRRLSLLVRRIERKRLLTSP